MPAASQQQSAPVKSTAKPNMYGNLPPPPTSNSGGAAFQAQAQEPIDESMLFTDDDNDDVDPVRAASDVFIHCVLLFCFDAPIDLIVVSGLSLPSFQLDMLESMTAAAEADASRPVVAPAEDPAEVGALEDLLGQVSIIISLFCRCVLCCSEC